MKRLTVSMVVFLTVWAVIAVIAFAQEPPEGESLDDRLERLRDDMTNTDSEDSAILMPEGDDNAQVAPNPYGCYGQTDNPHASSTSGYTDIVVKARTVCPTGPDMPRIGVDLVLMKGSVCIGTACAVWTAYSNISYNERQNARRVGGVAAGAPCENGVYMGESFHYVLDSNNILYYGYTENKHRVTGCPS